MALQECNGPLAQKEILPSLFEAARRHLVSQVCLGGAARIQSCTGSWSAAWVCAQPNAAFDTGLSDVAFVDATSMRLGLPVFSAEQACARCPQMLDVYAHHTVTCPMEGGKVRLHNQIRDAFFRCLSNAALGARLEPEGILPTEQGRRPADVLFVPTPLCRQSQWALYPHIALDFAVVSPFKVGEFQVAADKAQGIASSYAQTKRSYHATQERCRAQGIGFEPVVFEMLGGLEAEVVRLYESLCQAVDRKTQQFLGHTRLRLMSRVSIDIQGHVHRCCERARMSNLTTPEGCEASRAFLLAVS